MTLILYLKMKYRINNHYYVLDYLPQKVSMGFDADNATNTVSYGTVEDDYTKDIRIDINGLEGVERVVVEQLDEGNDLPIKFEVPDFKKGYFTATVDKELYTQFVVYSYNKNGSTKSDYLTIEPLSPIQELYNIQFENNAIKLSTHERNNQINSSKYTIYLNNLNNVSPVKKGVIETTNSTVDISNLKRGNYILSITSGKKHQNVKFVK